MGEYIHLGIDASLLNENEQLKDENAKLRKELKLLDEHCTCVSDNYAQALAELEDMSVNFDESTEKNAELCDIAKRLYKFAYHENPDGAEDLFAYELRELGIKVSEEE